MAPDFPTITEEVWAAKVRADAAWILSEPTPLLGRPALMTREEAERVLSHLSVGDIAACLYADHEVCL
jgi:hypothetical protein